MNRLNSVGVRLSIFCLSPTDPSVVKARTWVSPRWNSPVPCALGEIPVSQVSVRISSAPRPSGRSPFSMIRRRNSFSTNESNASVTSLLVVLVTDLVDHRILHGGDPGGAVGFVTLGRHCLCQLPTDGLLDQRLELFGIADR